MRWKKNSTFKWNNSKDRIKRKILLNYIQMKGGITESKSTGKDTEDGGCKRGRVVAPPRLGKFG